MDLRVGRVASLQGRLRPPSEKSLTHRAYMFGAIATGPSVVRSPLLAEDCESTLRCLTQMGLQYERVSHDEIRLDPASAWHSPAKDLDCGNSGTTMRLMSGLIASRDIEATLTGDASLSKRPMKRIAEPLRLMGAAVEGDTPPLFIKGNSNLSGIDYATPVASGQIKSCILLAGLGAGGTTTVREPSPSRDHTERLLKALGVDVEQDGCIVRLKGGAKLPGFEFRIPGDISSAAFFLVAASIIPESRVEFLEVSVNPTRTGILDVLQQAGVRITQANQRVELGEPSADLFLSPPDFLQPFRISGPLVPRLIDEIPVLSVLATQCDGVTEIRDAGELRVKESDRIELIATNLRAMGASVETTDDGLTIQGPTPLKAAKIETAGDHRIAMAFAIAGLIADGETMITGAESIQTSFPTFESDLWSLAVV